MKRVWINVLLMGLTLTQVLSLSPSGVAATIALVVPESDLREYRAERVRLAGHTEPGNQVFVNGKPVKVYPTGAFVDLCSLEVGANTIIIEASSAVGAASTSLRVHRLAPLQSTPGDVLAIEDELLLPERDLDLLPGDLFEVRFKGTPGGQASFSVGEAIEQIRMTETSARSAGELRGIYTGVHRLRPSDQLSRQPIRFHLEVPGLGEMEKSSQASLSVQSLRWPRTGEVISPDAYLAAGLGDGRLGGALLGYLPLGTRLELTGRVGDLYRVQLSPVKTAWIAKEAIRPMPLGSPPPRSLVGSATLQGDSRRDTYTVPLEVRLPYTLEAMMEPPRLVLDLYGATSNLTWITQHLSAEMIQRVSWEQVEDGRLRFRFDLKEPPVWGYSASYEGDSNRLLVTVRRRPKLAAPPASPLQGLTIALDAGHGGTNRGALGSLGTLEKEVNLEITKRLAGLLQARGGKPILTRQADESLDNAQRVLDAMDAGADFFVSIHANSVGLSADAARSRGTSTYYRHEPFRALSLSLYQSLLQLGLAPYGNIGSFNAAVLKRPDIPCVLVEMAFLSHPEEEALLLDPAFQDKLAQAILDGLADYLKAWRSQAGSGIRARD